MKSTDVINPTAIKFPVAYNGLKNSIPLNPTGSNLASITEGFPEMTMKALADGGLPPKGQDFNGLFYLATDYKAYLQDGGYITFNQTVSDLIGGYPAGAILDYYTPGTNSYTKVVSLIDDNTYNFNSDSSYIDGLIWKNVNFGGANQDLSNLTQIGENRLHALKGYLDNGTLLTDTTLFNDVYGYAHSTFDLTKFTVVGSLVISENGIASGFSNSNYINLSSVISNISSYTSVTYKGKFKTGQDLTTQQRILLNNNFSFMLTAEDSAIRYYYSSNGSSWDVSHNAILSDIVANAEYQYEITFTTTGAEIKVNDVTIQNTSGQVYELPYRLGQSSSSSISIDLKQVSVFVDGVSVFNGNKTGLDVFKADNYTVVGTPAISTEGIASGFSSANCIQKTFDNIDISNKTVQITLEDEFTQTPEEFAEIFMLTTSTGNCTLRRDAGANIINALLNGTYSDNTPAAKGRFRFEATITNGTNFKCSVYKNGEFVKTLTGTFGTQLGTLTLIEFGRYGATAYQTIDLNSIKVYINGDLVYQPCLKIPYTESSTGSKVVDVTSRGRVQDVYEQYGSALYYTIDEINKNVTLPFGEVYGFIGENKTEIATKQTIGDWCVTAPTSNISAGIQIEGALTNNNGVLSGFSDTKYAIAKYTFAPGSNTWEMIWKIKTGADVSTRQQIFSTPDGKLEIGIVSDKFNVEVNNIPEPSGTLGTYTVLANTTYYIKVNFTETAYTLSYSTSGTNYTSDISVSSSTPISQNSIYIGLDKNNNGEPFLGEIDINGCSIIVDNGSKWYGDDSILVSTATINKPAVVVENYLNGKNGYRVWSDGMIEQWGFAITTNPSGSTQTVNLFKQYSNDDYCVLLGQYISSGRGHLLGTTAVTTSSFTFSQMNAENTGAQVAGIWWKTIGY